MRRKSRRGPCRDDDAPGLNNKIVADLQMMVVEKAGHTAEAVFSGYVVDGLENEADEAITLVAYASHDGLPVNARFLRPDSECGRPGKRPVRPNRRR